MVARDRFDLVFMDMQMPELDGLDATRVIRAADSGYKVPILAMTANAFVEDKVLCRGSCMNDFITKPVDSVVLYAVMLRIFQSHTA